MFAYFSLKFIYQINRKSSIDSLKLQFSWGHELFDEVISHFLSGLLVRQDKWSEYVNQLFLQEAAQQLAAGIVLADFLQLGVVFQEKSETVHSNLVKGLTQLKLFTLLPPPDGAS